MVAAAMFVTISCGGDDPSVTTGAPSSSTGGVENGIPTAFGELCSSFTPSLCDEGRGACAKIGDLAGGLCTTACEGDSECPLTFRCTDTGVGKYCVERCGTTGDCPTIEGIVCASTAEPDEGVCWFGQTAVGEVSFTAKPVVVDMSFDGFEKGSWRMVPGSTVTLFVTVVNEGNKIMAGTSSVVSKHPKLTLGPLDGPTIQFGNYRLLPHTYGGSRQGNDAVQLSFGIQATIAPDAAWDEPLPFEIILQEGDGTTYPLTIAPPPRKPRVDFVFAPPTAFDVGNGQKAVNFAARNVGYGGATRLVTSIVVSPKPDVVNSAEPSDVGDGVYAPALLHLGNAYVDFAKTPSITVQATITDQSGESWTLNGTFTEPTP